MSLDELMINAVAGVYVAALVLCVVGHGLIAAWFLDTVGAWLDGLSRRREW